MACVTGDEDFLVLACDGLWDVVQPSDAIDLVVQHLTEGKERSSVAKMLVDHAKSAGSNDNISVVVVFLDPHKKNIPLKNNVVRLSAPEVYLHHGHVTCEESTNSHSVIDPATSNSNGEEEFCGMDDKSVMHPLEDDSHGSSICTLSCSENHTNGNLQAADTREKSPDSSPELLSESGQSRSSSSPKMKHSPNTLNLGDS